MSRAYLSLDDPDDSRSFQHRLAWSSDRMFLTVFGIEESCLDIVMLVELTILR